MSKINPGLYSSADRVWNGKKGIHKPIKWEVKEDGCWISTSHHSVRGYPRIVINGKTQKLHRVMYEKHKGPIPQGLILRHSCDNGWCINPEHLIPGTYLDNSSDMVSRNRQARGERQGSAKLTIDDVKAIRASNDSYSVLAERYGVSKGHVGAIKTGKKWRHV